MGASLPERMDGMRLGVVLTTFALVVPAELLDKTALASLVLATRYRALPVWLGAAGAFLLHCALAVTAGRLLGLLPQRIVLGVAALLFAVGAVVTYRSRDETEEVGETAPTRSPARMAATAFGVLFVAELGDFTQLATASLSARYDDPLSVFAGAWLALLVVSGVAVVAGRGLLRVVPLRLVRLAAACLFAVVAVVSAVEALRQQ